MQGRLGALYAALAANRALQAHLRHTVLPRVDAAIDANWKAEQAVAATPEAVAAARHAERAAPATVGPGAHGCAALASLLCTVVWLCFLRLFACKC